MDERELKEAGGGAGAGSEAGAAPGRTPAPEPGQEFGVEQELRREPRLRDVLFPPRGFSATEVLLAANILVAAALFLAWGSDYTSTLRAVTAGWWHDVGSGHAYGWWLPTIFMHAGPGHLGRNMLALVAAAGAVEFLSGRRATLAAYLATGIGAAAVSYLGRASAPLSVGASGAIFGLLGCAVAFIVRRRRHFNYAQRWKVWRVYIPLFVLFFVPAIVNADVYAHAGGFVCGLLLGPWLPLHPRIAALAAVDPLRDEEVTEHEKGPGIV